MSVSRCSEFGSGRVTAYTDRTRTPGFMSGLATIRELSHNGSHQLCEYGTPGDGPPHGQVEVDRTRQTLSIWRDAKPGLAAKSTQIG